MISNTAKPQLQINSPGQGEDVSKGGTTSASKSFRLFRWGQLSDSSKISFKPLPCTFIAHFHASLPQTASYTTTGWPGRPRKANHATRRWSMSLPVPPTLLQPELPLLPAHPCPTHHSEQPEVPVLSRAAVGEHIGPFSIDIVEVQRKAEKLQEASPCLGCCFLTFSGA